MDGWYRASPLNQFFGVDLDHSGRLAVDSYLQINGIYFITGDLLAHGKDKNKYWVDHIHYYLFKLTEYGKTQGVWSTNECKGYYMGLVK